MARPHFVIAPHIHQDRSLRGRAALVAIGLCLAACPAAPAAGDSPKAQAQKIWQTRCSNCHGTLGAGDGPSAAGLDPKPRSFHAGAWQASVDDAHIRKVIVNGGAAVGLSPSMAPNPDLDGKREVLDALVSKIRHFQK